MDSEPRTHRRSLENTFRSHPVISSVLGPNSPQPFSFVHNGHVQSLTSTPDSLRTSSPLPEKPQSGISLPPSLPPAPLPLPDTTRGQTSPISSRSTPTPSRSRAISPFSSPSTSNHSPHLSPAPVTNLHRHHSANPEASLVHSAVVDLTNIVKSNHRQSTQLFVELREEITTVLTTISFTMECFIDNMTGTDKKTKRISTALDNILITVHDYRKAEVTMLFVDPTRGFSDLPEHASLLYVQRCDQAGLGYGHGRHCTTRNYYDHEPESSYGSDNFIFSPISRLWQRSSI